VSAEVAAVGGVEAVPGPGVAEGVGQTAQGALLNSCLPRFAKKTYTFMNYCLTRNPREKKTPFLFDG